MASRTATGSAKDLRYAGGGSFLNGHAALTVVAWVKSDSTGTDRGFLVTNSTALGAGNDEPITCRYDAAGATGGGTSVIKLAIDATTKTNSGYESANNTQAAALQSLIFSWQNAGQEELWIDGVLDVPTARAAAYTGVTVNANIFYVHRGPKDGANAWDGIIYEIRVYNRKLTLNEVLSIVTMRGQDCIKDGLLIKWHPDQGAPGIAVTSVTDRSGNGRNGVNNGVVTFDEDVIHTRRRRAA